METNRSFYPDILMAHPFDERCVITYPTIINNPESAGEITGSFSQAYLIDMETSGLYQAASCFYQPHQMFFLKVVSDHLKDTDISPDKVTGLIWENIPVVTEWIRQVQAELSKNRSIFTADEENYITELAKALHLSVSMELKLRQLLKYSKLKEGGFTDRIRDFLQDKPLPCQTKTEGKNYFEQIKQLFL